MILCFLQFDEIKNSVFNQSTENLNYLKLKAIE